MHWWRWLPPDWGKSCEVPTSSSGAVLGSASFPKTLWHAYQGNWAMDIPITRRWLYPRATAALQNSADQLPPMLQLTFVVIVIQINLLAGRPSVQKGPWNSISTKIQSSAPCALWLVPKYGTDRYFHDIKNFLQQPVQAALQQSGKAERMVLLYAMFWFPIECILFVFQALLLNYYYLI